MAQDPFGDAEIWDFEYLDDRVQKEVIKLLSPGDRVVACLVLNHSMYSKFPIVRTKYKIIKFSMKPPWQIIILNDDVRQFIKNYSQNKTSVSIICELMNSDKEQVGYFRLPDEEDVYDQWLDYLNYGSLT